MSKKQQTERKIDIQERTIESFYEQEYFDYAKYVLEQRALPSIIDGLKPGARKIMNAAFKILSETKESNFMDLVGSTMSISKYHHGNSSIESTILTLGSYYSNNLNPLQIEGTGGSLRSNEAAAPRYLGVILSKYAKILKHNENILEYNYDGETKIEPKHYLPIIPLVLTNRTSGIAIGYSFSNTIPFHPVSLIQNCIEYLKTNKTKTYLIPHINEYDGEFYRMSSGRIYCRGKYSIDEKKNTIDIFEFSPDETFSKFEDNLIKLEEKTQTITKWENLSNEDNLHYRVYLNRDKLQNLIKKKKIESTFKISTFFEKSTLTMLDENNKLIEFSSHDDVLRYFVDYRLNKYVTLKAVILDDLKKQISVSSELMKFIDLYLKGKIKISKDISLEETIKTIKSFDLSESLIETKLSKLTKEEYEKLKNKISLLEDEYRKIEKTTPKELYLDDLNSLLSELKNDFKETKLIQTTWEDFQEIMN